MDDKTVTRIKKVMPLLNERQTRLYLAAEALSIGRGCITAVSNASGMDRNTISRGIRELELLHPELCRQAEVQENRLNLDRIRKTGGGRKPIEVTQPGIYEELEKIVNPESFGNPESPLRWTTKSLRNLSNELADIGYKVSHNKVGEMLESLGYSLQLNQKMYQVGEPHPDRDAQFSHINETCTEFLQTGNPVISVDCKKKENIGNFKNSGAEYSPKGFPTKVLDHDSPLPGLGKAAPYGVYDIGSNEGFVSVGISSDTAEFAVATIRSWWVSMGKEQYPEASKLYINADGGGSNGSRNKLWKVELQKFANEFGIEVTVSHFPPGTSKWNKIEHRLLSQISKNWRGKPLTSIEVIISLIASTTTEKGLKVKCLFDDKIYEKGIKVEDDELAKVNIVRNSFCGNWNYTILPQ